MNIIVTGVGGQGNVLAAKLLGAAFLARGFEVAVGDVFGLSQRGGAVASHVRASSSLLLPPLIPRSQVDFVLGLEPLEALRVLCESGGATTRVVSNDRALPPVGSLMERSRYPALAALREDLECFSAGVTLVDGLALAREAGQIQTLNVVMVGALVGEGHLPLSCDDLSRQIDRLLPARHREVNQRALSLGWAAVATGS